MNEINSFLDILALGIELKKRGVPNEFVLTLDLGKEKREKIYSEMLDYGLTPPFYHFGEDKKVFYRFSVFRIEFCLF